jgi:hypothetical protein
MNSLPFISHHLFVAAIGNEGRAREMQARRERPSVGATAPASAMAFEVMDDRRSALSDAARPLRASLVQARD